MKEKRLKICKECPIYNKGYCSKNKWGDVIKDFIYEDNNRIKGQIVNGCGCPLDQKTSSLSTQCPTNRW